MRSKKTSSVLIADDHAVVRTGIKFLLKSVNPEIKVVTAEDFPETLVKIRESDFDVVILDINIPGGNNTGMIDTIRRHRPEIPILIYTSYSEKLYGLPYLQAGASGFLSKEAPEQELFAALYKIEQGKKYLSSALQDIMLDSLTNSGSVNVNPMTRLSKREVDVVNLLVKGYSTGEISSILNLQLSTISTFKARVFAKMEVSNLVELIAKTKAHL